MIYLLLALAVLAVAALLEARSPRRPGR